MSDGEVKLDWSSLIGFDRELQLFDNLYREDRLAQVVLFEGRESIGKSLMMASAVARIFCSTGTACGVCLDCNSIKDGSHEELLWLDNEKSYKIEDAIKVQEHLSICSSSWLGESKKVSRVVVISNVDRMNHVAANRLLKTFEEPMPGALVLLSSSRPEQIISTIRSRVMSWKLLPPKASELISWLPDHLKEGVQNLESIIKQQGYAPGKVLNFLTNASWEEQQKVDQLVGILLFSDNLEESIDAAKLLVKTHNIAAQDLIRSIEFQLNDFYKKYHGIEVDISGTQSEKATLKWSALLARRASLHRLRELVSQGIPLNLQMLTESFALTR